MKERLTGAIILVALMVLLVPELLTGPIRSTPQTAALATVAGGGPLRSYTIELADENHARGATGSAGGPQQPAPLTPAPQTEGGSAEAQGASAPPSTGAGSGAATQPNPAPPASGAAATSRSTSSGGATSATRAASAAASSSSPPAAGSARGSAGEAGGAWVVQLGSFASRENADRLAQQVRSQGFQVSVSQSSSGRHLYRVRVGAAHDRAAALALAQKLRALGHAGTVQPKQGGA